MQALFTLTSSESKRLLGKAVASLPEVQHAKQNGYLVVGRGSTNAFILEELMNSPMDKERYIAGQIIKGVLCVLGQDLRNKPITFHKGEVQAVEPGSVIDKMTPGDILIKGGNAVDPFGNVGVLMSGPGGGTMGQFYMALKAQGVETIYPVGLEKLIPSVEEAARYGGKMALGRTVGCRVGMACVADGRVITEIEAIDILFGLKAVHYASAAGRGGGIRHPACRGEEEDVNRCLDQIEGIRGNPLCPPRRTLQDLRRPLQLPGQDAGRTARLSQIGRFSGGGRSRPPPQPLSPLPAEVLHRFRRGNREPLLFPFPDRLMGFQGQAWDSAPGTFRARKSTRGQTFFLLFSLPWAYHPIRG